MYYYKGTNPVDRSDGVSAGENAPGSTLYDQVFDSRGDLLVKYYSNIGADNPKKSGDDIEEKKDSQDFKEENSNKSFK
jgi:hypothetical protein